jgi:hypothetical protein
MCNCYWYAHMHVHALFHVYIGNNNKEYLINIESVMGIKCLTLTFQQYSNYIMVVSLLYVSVDILLTMKGTCMAASFLSEGGLNKTSLTPPIFN